MTCRRRSPLDRTPRQRAGLRERDLLLGGPPRSGLQRPALLLAHDVQLDPDGADAAQLRHGRRDIPGDGLPERAATTVSQTGRPMRRQRRRRQPHHPEVGDRRRISGSLTPARARVTCSVVGGPPTGPGACSESVDMPSTAALLPVATPTAGTAARRGSGRRCFGANLEAYAVLPSRLGRRPRVLPPPARAGTG